jgi:hypothetical protein
MRSAFRQSLIDAQVKFGKPLSTNISKLSTEERSRRRVVADWLLSQ